MVAALFDDVHGVPPGSTHGGFLTPAMENGGRTAECVLRIRPSCCCCCCYVCVAVGAAGGSSIASWSVVAPPRLKERSLFISFAFLLVLIGSSNTVLAASADNHGCCCWLIGLHGLLVTLQKNIPSVCLCVNMCWKEAGGRYYTYINE